MNILALFRRKHPPVGIIKPVTPEQAARIAAEAAAYFPGPVLPLGTGKQEIDQ